MRVGDLLAGAGSDGTKRWVCVGTIIGAHGMRGGVRIRSFTVKPADVGAYGPVWDKSGTRCFTMRVFGQQSGRNVVLADLDGLASRSEAESLRGVDLFVPRSALPEQEEETFYWADLVGLAVLFAAAGATTSQQAGFVRALHDFGAGTILEVTVANGCTIMVPFTRATVPEVNVANGWVRVASRQ